MNVNELTIGQAKELIALFSFPSEIKTPMLDPFMIGRYVIVRSRNEGVNCGVVEQYDSTGIVLKDARRLWYHKPKDESMSWYEGVALSGLSEGSKISVEVPRKVIIEDYSITVCSDEAERSLRAHKGHGQ